MVDHDLVLEKLRHIQAALARIQQKNPRSREELFGDLDTQDVVLRNLQNALQGCLDIASHVVADEGWGPAKKSADFFSILAEHNVIPQPLAPTLIRLIKFRNILVHEYTRLDLEKTWAIVHQEIPAIESYCQAITSFLEG